jgi:hypothetical protein
MARAHAHRAPIRKHGNQINGQTEQYTFVGRSDATQPNLNVFDNFDCEFVQCSKVCNHAAGSV